MSKESLLIAPRKPAKNPMDKSIWRITITSMTPTANTAIYPAESSKLLIFREDMNKPSVKIVKRDHDDK